MTAQPGINSAESLHEHREQAGQDLLRGSWRGHHQHVALLLSSDTDGVRGAALGPVTPAG